MMDAMQQSPTPVQLGSASMRVRRVDIVASVLSSSLMVTGAVVLLLAVMWALAGPGAVTLPNPIGIVDANQVGLSAGLDSPIEIPVDAGPQSQGFADELSSVVAVANEIAAEGVAALGESSGSERGQELGDAGGSRGAEIGTRSSGSEGVPAFERWQIIFEASDMEDYARQLDFFEIELGCVGGGVETVDYASSFSSGGIIRKGRGPEELRLYFAWREKNVLAGYDRELLNAAGITTAGRLTLRFIPMALERELLRLELEHARQAGGDLIDGIRRTAFRSERSGVGYRFVVVSQQYQSSH